MRIIKIGGQASMVNCKECQNCEKCDFSKVSGMHVNACSDFKQSTTNADRIRAMNDEELAQFLCKISICKPLYCPAYENCIEKKAKCCNG